MAPQEAIDPSQIQSRSRSCNTNQPFYIPPTPAVQGVALAAPSQIFSPSVHQATIAAHVPSSNAQAQSRHHTLEAYVAASSNSGSMRFAAAPAANDTYSMRPTPSSSSGGEYTMGLPTSHTSQIGYHLGGASHYLSGVGGNSSRLHRSSGDLLITTPSSTTPPSVASAVIWGARPHHVEKIQSAKQGPSTSAFRPDSGVATSALVRQHHNNSLHDGSNDTSRLCAPPLCEVELVRSVSGDYLTQTNEVAFGQERTILPSFSSRQATLAPPPLSHPATRHTLNVPHPRRQTYHDERSFRNAIVPTDLFPHPCQYSSVQEWLTGADVSLSPSPSPRLHRTPPPEVIFPELELLKTGIEDEEGLDGVVISGSGEVGVGVGSGGREGDVEMEEEDDDVDAEGSTEDELENVSDLEEVEVNSEQKQEVVDNPEVPKRPPQSSSEARSSEHDQAAASGAPEKARLPPPRSSIADILASGTVGTSHEIASRRSQSTNASPAPAPASSRESSVLSSADGEGETDDEYVDSLEEDGSSLAASPSPSPASSLSIPLSSLRPVASSSTASGELGPELYNAVAKPSASLPPQPATLAAPPKSSAKGKRRGPYKRHRPPAQPLDGIPEGAARYCEASQLYECTCHGRTYGRKGDLQRHLTEDSLPEVCDGCGRGFPRKDPRIRHWNQSPLCEAIHHVKNIQDCKEAARWKKRWSLAMFAPQMEQLVRDQISLLASGSEQVIDPNSIHPTLPNRTRTRVAAIRQSRRPKAPKRIRGSEGETEDDADGDDDDDYKEDSSHSTKLTESASVRDEMISESRRATLRKKN